MPSLTDTELADFRTAASAALGCNEVLEYVAQQHNVGGNVRKETMDRVVETLRPLAVVLWGVYTRTKELPRLRFRGFLFTVTTTTGGAMQLIFFRESEIVTVE